MLKKLSSCAGVCLILALLILTCGCIGESSFFDKNVPQSDPETGVVNWIQAINAHDPSALYYLAPSQLRNQISIEQFKIENANNTLLERDKSISQYQILNQTENSTMANLKVLILLQQNVTSNSTTTETIPLYLNFEEWYENGAWRVWTIPWS